jgi:hypothetical protein
VKTNAGQLDHPLLRDVTGGTTIRATSALAHKDSASLPKQSPHWRGKVASLFRAGIAAFNALLTQLGRFGKQAAPVAPRTASVTIALRKNEVINLTRRPRAKCMRVLNGVIWLTGLPSAGDVLLSAGELLSLPRGVVYVIQALGDATLVLES